MTQNQTNEIAAFNKESDIYVNEICHQILKGKTMHEARIWAYDSFFNYEIVELSDLIKP